MRLASQTNGNVGRLQFGTGPTIEYANAGRPIQINQEDEDVRDATGPTPEEQ